MKVAVVGTGISGLAAARTLSRRHEVSVFESSARIGGHTHTIDVDEDGRRVPVDTGFIVFNKPNYPKLCRLFDTLGVESRESNMSFSVHCERTGIEYNGTSFDRLFVQPRNLLRREHWRMLSDIGRFNREAPLHLAAGLDDRITVSDYVQTHGYNDVFVDRYLVPLGASLWSTGGARFGGFPMRFVIEFLHNHGMLKVNGRPRWRTVVGGSKRYLEPLTAPFAGHIHVNCPVSRVARHGRGVRLTFGDGHQAAFDEVVLACHADQALNLIEAPDPEEADMLRHFPYEPNVAVLHTDTAMLPRARRAWASWNYRIPRIERERVSVTYNMNMLQGLDTRRTYCVTLNPEATIDPARIIRRMTYAHPVFEPGRRDVQGRHHEMVRRRGVSYCGAYWGYGFHEDGLRSALVVGEAFDLELAA